MPNQTTQGRAGGGLKALSKCLLTNPIARSLLLYPAFWAGYLRYAWTGRTPLSAYFAFRQLYAQTRGGLNQRLARAISRRHPATLAVLESGLLGRGDTLEAELGRALDALRTEGYYRFAGRLPESLCRPLRDFAARTPARLRPAPALGPPVQVFDPNSPQAPTYDFDEEALLAEGAVQRILADPTLLVLAARYLDCRPVNDLVAMWWSGSFAGRSASEAAQLYHYDLDRIRFFKLFIYLTDVGPRNGPHCYIRGSHRSRPAPFFEDRRFDDAEVVAAFPADSIVEVVAPAGTIIAGDTTCLHKGKPPDEGSRLILQFEFANSLFGAPYGRVRLPTDLDPALEDRLSRDPDVFRRFLR